MTRAEKAREYFLQGYACSQAVALAFADLLEMDEASLKKIMLPFGGGLGRQRLTCGAVSGMCAVYGLLFAGDGLDADNKRDVYAGVRELCDAFKKENGSIICEDLLLGRNLTVEKGGQADARTEEYYKKRPCGELVYIATKLLEEKLEK